MAEHLAPPLPPAIQQTELKITKRSSCTMLDQVRFQHIPQLSDHLDLREDYIARVDIVLLDILGRFL